MITLFLVVFGGCIALIVVAACLEHFRSKQSKANTGKSGDCEAGDDAGRDWLNRVNQINLENARFHHDAGVGLALMKVHTQGTPPWERAMYGAEAGQPSP